MSYPELSFQFAKEIATQLITLSSALIGVSVTFVKDFKSDNVKPLRISWFFYLLTIVAGVWTLMTLTGTLEGLSAPNRTFDGFPGSTRLAALVQILSFILGTIALVIFGWSHALERHPATAAPIAPPTIVAAPAAGTEPTQAAADPAAVATPVPGTAEPGGRATRPPAAEPEPPPNR